MKKADVKWLFEAFARANPHPQGELLYENAYQLLVAVALSAQATDKSVNAATRSLFAQVKTPAEMLALGEEALIGHIRTIGLFRTKAAHVMKAAALLQARHGGQVPNDQAALEALPGVGRKTATVVRNIAFGEPTIAVDTHIFRVSNRLGLACGTTPLAVEKGLMRAIPAAYRLHAHHWLILHGRYICTARAPKCGVCPVAPVCAFVQKSASAGQGAAD